MIFSLIASCWRILQEADKSPRSVAVWTLRRRFSEADQPFIDTLQTCHRHVTDMSQTRYRHVIDTLQTCHRHVADMLQTPIRWISNHSDHLSKIHYFLQGNFVKMIITCCILYNIAVNELPDPKPAHMWICCTYLSISWMETLLWPPPSAVIRF